MVGTEFMFSKTSIQFEIDASIINGKSHIDEFIEYNDNLTRESSTILVSGSAGLNFFKPDKRHTTNNGPYPTPVAQQKQNVPKKIWFDPITGKEIVEYSEKREFDPLTGKSIRKPQKESKQTTTFLGGTVSDIRLVGGKTYKSVKVAVSNTRPTYLYAVKRCFSRTGKNYK